MDFKIKTFEVALKSIESVPNESVLYEIVNTKGVLFQLSGKFNRVLNDGTEITLRSAILKDNTDTIPVTFYGKYGDDLMDGNCYKN